MKNRYLLLALALIVVINTLVLLGIAFNRGGEPEATLILTERELDFRLERDEDENNGISLNLEWMNYYPKTPWFDEHKLKTLGFDIEAIKQNGQDWSYYQRLLPRKGYVVLEYEGEAWLTYVADKEAEIARLEKKKPVDEEGRVEFSSQIARIREDLLSRSRLFAIDVGPEPELLRQRYPDRSRFVIAATKVRARFANDDEAKVYGTFSQLLVNRLHVPLSLQAPLIGLPEREYLYSYDAPPEVRDWEPRYIATVNWGRRLEPWVEIIELTTEGIKVFSE